MRYPKNVTLTCPECSTTHTGVPVEMDEDGPHAEIETTPCMDDECTKQLCSCCPQFVCEQCGSHVCDTHPIAIEEYEDECTCRQTDVDQFDASYCRFHSTEQPYQLRLCRVCAQPEPVEVPRIPPQPEHTRLAEVA